MDVDMDAGADGPRTPLLISPIFRYEKDDKVEPGGYYETVQRLVTAAPNDSLGEVETCLEEYTSDSGDCLWRRVAVRGGPGRGDGPARFLHASFALPMNSSRRMRDGTSDYASDNVMCWAAFPDRPDHKLLCVLATASLLCIWDVYPSQDETNNDSNEGEGGGEGHSVTLPFEARAVYPLGEHHGVLVQRVDTIDDHFLFEFDSIWMKRTDEDNMEEDNLDDDFVLQDPPKPLRLGAMVESLSPSAATPSFDATFSKPQAARNSIPAIFSLRHPLNEVLPVATHQENAEPSLFSDVYEQLLYVGTPKWTDRNDEGPQKQLYSQPICVTYHTRLKRHAVWQLKSAPPPSPTLPLWQISRNQRTPGHNLGFDDTQLGTEDAAFGNIIGSVDMDPDTSLYEDGMIGNRNEALADALGVNISTRADDPALVSADGRGGGRPRRSGSLSAPPAFLTPPPVDTQKDYAEHVDPTSMKPLASPKYYNGTPRNAATGLILDTSFSSSPFSNLHPDVAMTLLYEEDTMVIANDFDAQASDVFLTSNTDGSGTLLVSLLCPVQEKVNPFELRSYSINLERRVKESKGDNDASSKAIESPGYLFSLTPLTVMPCLSAQPIEAYPIPHCFVPRCNAKNRDSVCEPMATDMLILKADGVGEMEDVTMSLGLYRTGLRIVDCALSETEFIPVMKMENAVSDRIDFICQSETGKEFVIRGKLSLAVSSSPLAENVLAAVESALITEDMHDINSRNSFVPAKIELALKIRADCIGLMQALCAHQDEDILILEDPAWSAVATVLKAVIGLDLLGTNYSGISFSSGALERADSSGEDEDWEALLISEYSTNYDTEPGPLLFGFGDGKGKNGFSSRDTASSMRSTEEKLRAQLQAIHSHSCYCLRRELSSQLGLELQSSGYTRSLFHALHLLYEDSKLRRTSRTNSRLRAIGSILVHACALLDKIVLPGRGLEADHLSVMSDFLDYYGRDLGRDWLNRVKASVEDLPSTILFRGTPGSCRGILTTFAQPPCFLSWISDLMRGNSQQAACANIFFGDNPAKFNAACKTTYSLHRIYSILFRGGNQSADSSTNVQHLKDVEVINAMLQEGMDDSVELRDELPVGLILPLMETLHRCREDARTTSNSNWPPQAWSLIGRADLGQHFGNISSPSVKSRTNKDGSSIVVPRNIGVDPHRFLDSDKDGIVPLELNASMLFLDDNRIREAGRLLRSSRPTFLRVSRSIETSDHDFERLKQEKLLILCRRVLALPIGRGMLTLGTLRPVPAEPLPLPELCLSGRVPPTNATLKLDISDCPTDMKVWPDFHNGVAAGLRLVNARDCPKDTIREITRTWIVYNRPIANANQSATQNGNTPNNSPNETLQADHVHGGLLMALGLRGHLSALSMTDIYDYLTQGTVTTTVGILLGMAANKAGTCDPSVSKMLCLHIPSLLPPSFAAIDVAGPAQAAAVAGIGLLYQKSSHRLMTEFLLSEMGKRPGSDTSTCDREAYTLSCGLALGMVNLSQGALTGDSLGEGGGSAGLEDLHIEERLHRYIVGGIDDTEVRRQREAADRSSNPQGISTGEAERCSQIFEGDTINTDVTSPGATLALGLMFLQSGNKAIASSLSLPDTHFLLEYVRPDFLFLRVVARALILWDDVKPHSTWIDDQIPGVVRSSFKRMRGMVESTSGFANPSVTDARDNEVLSDTTHCGGQIGEDSLNASPGEKKMDATPSQEQGDRQAIRQIHAHVVAGACFAIGLRFAGTGDQRAAEAIAERAMEFLTLRDENDPISVALRPEQPILEMCLGSTAIALAMVMAGTGDLDTLRLFKLLRWRCDESVRYGTHMAFGTAIGLLFLGGGTCTLGRSPEDIAALVIAFFPRFPSSTSDNRYHLQALRHCYALAVKRQELVAVDVDTGERVSVPVEIELQETPGQPMQLSAPVLLRNTYDTPTKLRVVSERYYPLSLDVNKTGFLESDLTLFVKKRSGFLGHFQDPHSQRSLLVQTGSSSKQSALELIQSFTEDPRILAYAQYLCDNGQATPPSQLQPKVAGSVFAISEFCTSILHECLTGDKEDALPLYLSLQSAIESLKSDPATAAIQTIWDIRLIRCYYEEHHRLVGGQPEAPRLLRPEFVSFLCEMLDCFLLDMGLDEASLLTYLHSCGHWDDRKDHFGCFLVWYEVPALIPPVTDNIDGNKLL